VSSTDASQVCLGKIGVCQLGCVEFIYTSVSRNDTLSLLTTADGMASIGKQVDAAMIFARSDFLFVAALD